MQTLIELPDSSTWGRQVEIREQHDDGTMTVYVMREGGRHAPVSSGFQRCYAQELPNGDVWACVPMRGKTPILTFEKAIEVFHQDGYLRFAEVHHD